MHTAMDGPIHAASANEDERISFCVRERFKSFQQLEGKIQQYEQQHFVKFWKRDCGTVQAAQNRPLSGHINYYQVTFCCIHGGKKFKARGEGKRSSL